jgi:hypothetical protein
MTEHAPGRPGCHRRPVERGGRVARGVHAVPWWPDGDLVAGRGDDAREAFQVLVALGRQHQRAPLPCQHRGRARGGPSALPTAWPNLTLDERRQALLFARG